MLGIDTIAFVVGDREFVSAGLLHWLTCHKVGFRLRLRHDILLTDGRGETVTAGWLFRRFGRGQEKRLAGVRQCLEQSVFVSGMRFTNDRKKTEFLIVVSNIPSALSDYGLRWGIENLFSGLKSRGFDLEATHLLETERLSRLLSVLAMAFAWCVAVGEVATRKRAARGKPTKVKGHGRLAISVFREGLDSLRNLLAPLCGQVNQPALRKLYKFCTVLSSW